MEALLKIFSEAGIQWMGWALACGMVVIYVRRDRKLIEVIDKNTHAIATLTVLFEERLPRS